VRLATECVPLAGHFERSFAAVNERERHDNASLTAEAIAHVRKKFTKEEKLSYHILFPRFIWAFIPGLFLALITWIAPKGRPGDDERLCVDPSTILDNEGDAAGTPDDGAANTQLPRTGAEDREDENPPVYYGTAFLRFLIWIYNLRVDQLKTSASPLTTSWQRSAAFSLSPRHGYTMGNGVSRVFSYTVRHDLWGSQLPVFLYDSG